ncbi:hypothetical protein H4I96_03586 [Botrytis cinerea]
MISEPNGKWICLFSVVSLNLDGDTPYTDNDIVANAKAMTSDFFAIPENKIIDITTIDTECTDSSEYIKALTKAGSGITMLSAPKVEEEEAEPIQDEKEGASTALNSPKPNATINTVSEYRLTLQRFKCHHKQNDAVGAGRNEIY